jgi:hypothetical protein
MTKYTYITLGQDHVHHIDGKLINKDCVAVIPAETAKEGRDKAFELFGPKFCFEYFDSRWNEESLKYYPRGYVYL